MVDEQYARGLELEDKYVGYANVTIKDLLDHIKDEYCVIITVEQNQAEQVVKTEREHTTHIKDYDYTLITNRNLH